MTIARIDNGAIAETRSDLTIADVPAHKRERWRPIEGDQPAHDPRVETINGPVLVIEPDRVVRQWTVQRRPDVELSGLIKLECRRRILERFPDWKQANIQAREGELHRIQVGLMRDAAGELIPARSLTESELAEEIAIAQSWAWIKATRSASDAIEVMTPIPADYADDARWPA